MTLLILEEDTILFTLISNTYWLLDPVRNVRQGQNDQPQPIYQSDAEVDTTVTEMMLVVLLVLQEVHVQMVNLVQLLVHQDITLKLSQGKII